MDCIDPSFNMNATKCFLKVNIKDIVELGIYLTHKDQLCL